jgi:quercetin dioxygenase-like cupin family protein
MLLEVDGERHILNKGDSMHFQSHLPHRSATLGREPTLELWVRTQPFFFP